MQRWQANALQLVVLAGLGILASRDVERTMNQQPVSAEQTRALQAHLAEVRKR